jgi:hypothetical protein
LDGAPRHPVNDGLPQGNPVERRAHKGKRRLAGGLCCLVLCETEADLTEISIQLIMHGSSEINGGAEAGAQRG